MSDEKRKQPRWQGQVVRVSVPLEEALAAYELKRLLAGDGLEEAREQAWREDEDRGRPLTTVSSGTAPAEETPSSPQEVEAEAPPPEATPENVSAERARRIADGEPHGYKALAKHFLVRPTTIRRRLGKL